eukprot:GHVP01024199.1.p1 GENE.GHVP01024199.1~~GHVP01024199.1.p1  ORF type:complete len:355 (+),score=43.02 GHVP01024199.1:65-1129(+)
MSKDSKDLTEDEIKDRKDLREKIMEEEYENADFFDNFKELMKNDSTMIETIKMAVKSFINEKEICDQIDGAQYQGFMPEVIIEKFLAKLDVHKTDENRQKFFKSFILLVAVGVSRGTSRKALMRSKNDKDVTAAMQVLGLDVPVEGSPFTINRETMTLARLMTVHPLLSYIVHNIEEPSHKFNSAAYGVPKFLASPSLVYMAARLGWRDNHRRWYSFWFKEIIKLPANRKPNEDLLLSQYDAGTFVNKPTREYNALYLPILEKTQRLGKHFLFFTIIFKDNGEKAPFTKSLTDFQIEEIITSIDELIGPSFEEERFADKIEDKEAAKTISSYIRTKVHKIAKDSSGFVSPISAV